MDQRGRSSKITSEYANNYKKQQSFNELSSQKQAAQYRFVSVDKVPGKIRNVSSEKRGTLDGSTRMLKVKNDQSVEWKGIKKNQI